MGLFASACGVQHPPQTSASAAAQASPAPLAKHAESDAAPVDSRKVGDFYVHRFSGSYEKAPLLLTEEIVAQEDGRWVIDYTFEEPTGTTKLRVRLDPATDSVVRVAKLDGTRETPVALAVYDKLIERTSFAADSNDGLVASQHGTCLVGPSELDCETKSYRVMVGEKSATLNVSHSDQVPGRDVAGDITTSDGKLLYRSELVEMGNAASPKHGVASLK